MARAEDLIPEPASDVPALVLAYVDEKYVVHGFSPLGVRALEPGAPIYLGICPSSCDILVRLKTGGSAKIGGRRNLVFLLDEQGCLTVALAQGLNPLLVNKERLQGPGASTTLSHGAPRRAAWQPRRSHGPATKNNLCLHDPIPADSSERCPPGFFPPLAAGCGDIRVRHHECDKQSVQHVF